MSAREAQHPFEPGFKRTFYVYYTRKELLHAGSDVMRSVGRVIEQACDLGPMVARGRPEEPDMIYLAVMEDGAQRGGVFVRNSGTEEKTGVNVRGPMQDADALVKMGEQAVLHLAAAMKDRDHAMAMAELAVLKALSDGALPEADLPIPEGVHRERLVEELANKEKVIRACEGGYERTDLGDRMLEALA